MSSDDGGREHELGADHGAAVGRRGRRRVLAAAAALAEPFQAELACVHAPPDVADLMPWMGEGFMGGVQASAVRAISDAAAEGASAAQAPRATRSPTPTRASAP